MSGVTGYLLKICAIGELFSVFCIKLTTPKVFVDPFCFHTSQNTNESRVFY